MSEDRNTQNIAPKPLPLADQFRREMESMMSRFFGGASTYFPLETAAQRTGLPSLDMRGAIAPAIDVNETETAIELTAELPGLSEDDVEIELKDRRLTLSGQKKVTHDRSGDIRISERSYGSFSRSMLLPESVDTENVTADFDKGVLRIKMPKSEPENPARKVKISSN